jgi:hypothetical protein
MRDFSVRDLIITWKDTVTEQTRYPFVVGGNYCDRLGEYRVISLDGNRMVFEYSDGVRRDGEIERKALIYENILRERRLVQPILRSRSVNTRAQNDNSFSHEDVFPLIAAIIELHSSRSAQFQAHDEIVFALLERPEAQPFLDSCPTDESKTRTWWAHNMVAWFSKVFTDGQSDWQNRFERKKLDGKWAYRVKQTQAAK